MIQLATAPPCGNAAAILVSPDAGATAWALLRRLDEAFSDVDDAAAVTVETGGANADNVLDIDGLINGTTYFYQHFCLVDGVWQASGDPHSVVPAYRDQPLFHAPDVAAFVRQRLDLGLRAELSLRRISHQDGAILVLSAPP